MDTDADLLTRVRNGDDVAFAGLVSRYQRPMLRLARSLVPSDAVAEEAVQDTWMGVVRGIDRFEGRSSFRTWLFRILVNRARSAGARERPGGRLDSRPAVDPSSFTPSGQWVDPVEPWPDAVDGRIDAAAWLPVLAAALGSLPERQRQVVILRDVEGMSNEETCAVLGISSGNQRILLHRGRSRLRQILAGEMGKG